MTIEETVKYFISKTVKAIGGMASNYYCSMTNNPERRRFEHGASKLLCSTKCSDRDCARNLMRQLAEAGFDVDNDIMSGQDDSVYVYSIIGGSIALLATIIVSRISYQLIEKRLTRYLNCKLIKQ